MKIDIGSGGFKRPGFVGLDIVPGEGVDLICNIERSWRSMEPVRRLSDAVRGRTTNGSGAA